MIPDMEVARALKATIQSSKTMDLQSFMCTSKKVDLPIGRSAYSISKTSFSHRHSSAFQRQLPRTFHCRASLFSWLESQEAPACRRSTVHAFCALEIWHYGSIRLSPMGRKCLVLLRRAATRPPRNLKSFPIFSYLRCFQSTPTS